LFGLLSVVIGIINVKSVGGDKAENHPPVRTYRYRLKAFEIAPERMQPKAGHVHIRHHPCRVEPREYIAELTRVLGENAARGRFHESASVPCGVSTRSSFTVTRYVTDVKLDRYKIEVLPGPSSGFSAAHGCKRRW
jgi:hypothetical protein